MPSICSRCQWNAPDPDAPMFCPRCGGRMAVAAVALPTYEMEVAPAGITAADRRLRLLGSGSMGDVYEVERADGSRVAIKYIAESWLPDERALIVFRNEARVAKLIDHPRCVKVLNIEEEPTRIVMELMQGRTLKDLVSESGPVEPLAAVRYALDMLEGLSAVHAINVIHCDVKPANCFLTDDDRLKIGDFGLSSRFGQSANDSPLGTVLFASPEQLLGKHLGFDSDQYSACATLYYLLSGRAPHESTSVTAALAKAMSEPAPPLRGRGVEVPPALEKAVLKGLERDRNRRWPSLERLRKALEPHAGAANPKGGWLGRLFGKG